MLLEVLVDDDFLELSSSKRLVSISGVVKAIELIFLQVKDMGLHVYMEGSTAAPPLPWW
jgi:hypothetical protein